jgi:hypothetical protein
VLYAGRMATDLAGQICSWFHLAFVMQLFRSELVMVSKMEVRSVNKAVALCRAALQNLHLLSPLSLAGRGGRGRRGGAIAPDLRWWLGCLEAAPKKIF